MTPFQARISLLAFLFLVGSVALNAMLFQSARLQGTWTTSDFGPGAGSQYSGHSRDAQGTVRTGAVHVSSRTSGAASQASEGPIVDPAAAQRVSVDTSGNRKTASPVNTRNVEPTAGNAIAGIQRELTARGYEPGPVDGVVGLMTRAALLAYEYDEGLALTASPTEDRLKQLIFGLNAPAARAQSGRPATKQAAGLIRSVQDSLGRLGYAAGIANGELDYATRSAIRAFERDHGMAPTGRVSGRLLSQLNQTGKVRLTIAAEWN